MNKKMLKVLGAGGLALFMGIGTLCGVLLAPASAAAQASVSGGGDEILTAPQQLLAGMLEFDPENDPVIFTTASGIEIRWAQAALPENSGDLSILTGYLNGYAYINHNNTNWAIIGYSNKTTTLAEGSYINVAGILSYYSSFSGYNENSIWQWIVGEDTNPAKTDIYNDVVNCKKDVIYNLSAVTMKFKNAIFPNAVSSSELEGNEVLCLSQSNLTTTQFHASSSHSTTNNYNGSVLKSYIDSYYNNYMTSLPIVQKNLKTRYVAIVNDAYTYPTSSINAYMFPLAGNNNSETFYYDTYLNAGSGGNMDIDATWFLRSCNDFSWNGVMLVDSNGNVTSYNVVNRCGVRPAFVLSLV